MKRVLLEDVSSQPSKNFLTFFERLNFIKKYEVLYYPTAIWSVTLFSTIICVLISKILMSSVGHSSTGFFGMDGPFFLHIAEFGYTRYSLTPFFPLLPILMRLLHNFTQLSFETCGFIIVNVFYWFAVIIFYKLLIEKMELNISRKALWLLALFPPAFFFNVLYTESLTLFTTILFFYFLNRNNWYKAMVSGFFAGIAHTLGVILAPAGLWYLVAKRKEISFASFWIRFSSLGIIGAGLLAYMVFLQCHFHNPLSFLLAEKLWGRTPTIPVISVLINFKNFIIDHPEGLTTDILWNTVNGFCTLTMTLMVFIALWSYRHHNLITPELKIFFLLTFLASICSGANHGSLQSYGRFMSVLFPGFIIWADKFGNNSTFLFALAIMIPLKMVLCILFSCSY